MAGFWDPLALGIMSAGQSFGDVIKQKAMLQQQQRQQQLVNQDLAQLQRFQDPGNQQFLGNLAGLTGQVPGTLPPMQSGVGQNLVAQNLASRMNDPLKLQMDAADLAYKQAQTAQLNSPFERQMDEANLEYVKERTKALKIPKTEMTEFERNLQYLTPEQQQDARLVYAGLRQKRVAPTRANLQAQEILRLQSKAQSGALSEKEKARLDNLLLPQAGNTVINNLGLEQKVGSKAYYDDLDQSAKAVEFTDTLLKAFDNGGSGASSVGPIDAALTYIQDITGFIPEDKQVFIQDRTKLFQLIKTLNGEKRMSDADLKFLNRLIPKTRANDKAYRAGIENLNRQSKRELKQRLERIQGFNYILPNTEYYQGLMQEQPSGTQQIKVSPGNEDLLNMSEAELEAIKQGL